MSTSFANGSAGGFEVYATTEKRYTFVIKHFLQKFKMAQNSQEIWSGEFFWEESESKNVYCFKVIVEKENDEVACVRINYNTSVHSNAWYHLSLLGTDDKFYFLGAWTNGPSYGKRKISIDEDRRPYRNKITFCVEDLKAKSLLLQGSLQLVFKICVSSTNEQLMKMKMNNTDSLQKKRSRTENISSAGRRAFRAPRRDAQFSFCTSGKFTDVILISEDVEYKCHKVILASQSEVFNAMFSHSDFEENVHGKVHIDDMDAKCLGLFIKFLYTAKLDDESLKTHAVSLLRAADKYNVSSLKSLSSQFLCGEVKVENAAQLAILGHMHGEVTLKNRAIEVIVLQLAEVKATNEWKDVLKDPQLCDDIFDAVAQASK